MKRVLTITLICCVLTTAALFSGCAKKGIQVSALTYTGAILVEDTANAERLPADVFTAPNTMSRYSAEAFQNESAAAVREWEHSGILYVLKYQNVSYQIKDASRPRVLDSYILPTENITESMRAALGDRADTDFSSKQILVTFADDGAVTKANYLPDLCWRGELDGEQTVVQEGVRIAATLTEHDVGAFDARVLTQYLTADGALQSKDGFYAVKAPETLEDYIIILSHRVGDYDVGESVIVHLLANGYTRVDLVQLDGGYTEEDLAKIKDFDAAPIHDQACAWVAAHLNEAWCLTDWNIQHEEFFKKNGKLWISLKAQVQTAERKNSKNTAGGTVTLCIEIV